MCDKRIKIYSFQKIGLSKKIGKDVPYHAKKILSEHYGLHKKAYDWLINKMAEEKNLFAHESQMPIFAWYRVDNETPVPYNLEFWEKCGANPGKQELWVLNMDPEKILFSEADAWKRSVIRNRYESIAINQIQAEKEFIDFLNLKPDKKEYVKQQSWNRVLFTDAFQNDFRTFGYNVQASFWEVTQEEIEEVIQLL